MGFVVFKGELNGVGKMVIIKKEYFIKRSEQGGTLIEVMITTLILSFAIVGTIAVFAKCSVFVGEIRGHTIINNALNERMEEIRGMPYSSVSILPTTFTATGFNELKNATGTLTLEDSFSDSNIRKVTLTANWTSPQGRSMSKSMVTYVTNNGINKQ